jgi:ubiquinone/menaquinone biosynthesis C-methylase UbiE
VPAEASDVDARNRFWTEYQPGFRVSAAPVGTRRFFEEVEAHRYSLEPAIPEMAAFERWCDKDVLEAGCGIATDGINFARAGARYTGVDFSKTALSVARERFAEEGRDGRFVQGSVAALPFEDDSFDLVYSNGVLHHIPEVERAVGEIHRVLRPGGRAVVMLYHRDSLNHKVNILLLRRIFAVLLILPGVPRLIGMLTGERESLLVRHRRLLMTHGLHYLTDRQLFLSNNTDGPGNPYSRVYGRSDGARLFRDFARVTTRVRFLNLRIYPFGEWLATTRLARALERRIGWHLWIEAVK